MPCSFQNSGFDVVTTKEARLALKLVGKQDFDAVVICSSIPLHLRENIALEVKRLRPALPLIVICGDKERGQFRSLADLRRSHGDLYSCDHFVYPENKLGNIMESPA